MKGIVLNDVHFGVKDSERIYNELETVFLSHIENNKVDVIFIAGDYFHCKLSVGDPATFLAMSFFQKLVTYCKKNNTKLRMIQGTFSHDLNQLSLFYPFIGKEDFDFKIIENVSEEEFPSGFKVLYVPEEYPEDSEEYYKEFKAKEYSAIIGHGTWEFVAFQNQIEHGNKKGIMTAPVFIFDEWKESIKNGFVSFGHIHSRNVYKKKIFYSGSFSRWDFSDISERGFTEFNYNENEKTFSLNFVNNDKAPLFKSYSLRKEIENFIELSFEEISIILDTEINSCDYISIDLTGITKDKYELFKSKFKENKKVKLKFESSSVSLKEDAEKEEKFSKYNYIIKKELPIDETVKKFIKEEFNEEVSLDKIKTIIK